MDTTEGTGYDNIVAHFYTAQTYFNSFIMQRMKEAYTAIQTFEFAGCPVSVNVLMQIHRRAAKKPGCRFPEIKTVQNA